MEWVECRSLIMSTAALAAAVAIGLVAVGRVAVSTEWAFARAWAVGAAAQTAWCFGPGDDWASGAAAMIATIAIGCRALYRLSVWRAAAVGLAAFPLYVLGWNVFATPIKRFILWE